MLIMRKIVIRKLVLYSILTVASAVISELLSVNMDVVIADVLSACISYFAICIILFDIGRSIKTKELRKKYIVYTCILVSEILLILMLSVFIGVSTENTWLGVFAVIVLFSTVSVMICLNAKPLVADRPILGYSLYCVVFLLVIMAIANIIAYFTGV